MNSKWRMAISRVVLNSQYGRLTEKSSVSVKMSKKSGVGI